MEKIIPLDHCSKISSRVRILCQCIQVESGKEFNLILELFIGLFEKNIRVNIKWANDFVFFSSVNKSLSVEN